MIENVTTLAEALATRGSVSRRAFMGLLGQRALVAAGAISGLLLTRCTAKARNPVITGACWVDGVCHDAWTETNCVAAGGTYAGDWSHCPM